MGWANRGGRRYYYGKERRGGRVRSVYVGADPAAVAAWKALRALEGARLRSIAKEYLEPVGLSRLVELCYQTDQLLTRVLTGAGLHQHRGQWRRRRGEGSMSRQIIARLLTASRTDPEACVELWREIDADGHSEALSRAWTDLSETLLTADFQDLVHREALRRRVSDLRLELGGRFPSTIEALVIDRICVCWLDLYRAQIVQANGRKQQVKASVAARLEDAVSQAQRRFLGAVRALATVRRLAIPSLQINVADQQINVASVGDLMPAPNRIQAQ